MKSILLFFMAFALASASFAFSGHFIEKKADAGKIYIAIGASGNQISLLDLSRITVRDYQRVSGKKMNLFDKIGFKMAQRQLKKSINTDGTINNKALARALEAGDGTTGFHLGGFALGFLLSLIGVLIAYLINDNKKSNRVKWAWIGLGVGIILSILFII